MHSKIPTPPVAKKQRRFSWSAKKLGSAPATIHEDSRIPSAPMTPIKMSQPGRDINTTRTSLRNTSQLPEPSAYRNPESQLKVTSQMSELCLD